MSRGVSAPPGAMVPAPEAEALIEEARHHQRRRRRWVGTLVLVALLAVALELGVAGVLPGTGRQAPVGRAGAVRVGAGLRRSTAALVGAQWRTPGTLQAVSCAAGHCVAVGDAGGGSGVAPGSPGVAHAQILVSTDGGVRWAPGVAPSGAAILAGVACAGPAWCLAVGQGPPRAVPPALVASLHVTLRGPNSIARGLAFVSHDGGVHWAPVPLPAQTGPLVSLSCWSATACVAVGAAPVLVTVGHQQGLGAVAAPSVVALATDDGGASWTPLPLPVSLLRATAVSCGPAGGCLISGETGEPGPPVPVVLVSSSGAVSWHLEPPPAEPAGPQAVVSSPELLQAVSCPGPGHCVAWGAVPDAGPSTLALLVTTDGGASWTVAAGWRSASQLADGQPGRLTAVDCPTVGRCVASIGGPAAELAPEVVLVSEDGGARWQVIAPETAHLPQATAALHCQTSGACVAVGATTTSPAPWLAAAWTTNPAGAWYSATLPVALASLSTVACSGARRCVAVGAAADGAGVAVVSANDGASWSAAGLPAGTPPLQAAWCAADGHCLAVADIDDSSTGGFEVVVSHDAGRVWTRQSGSPHPGSLTALSCPSRGVCWAVGGTAGGGTLVFGRALALRTTDGGARWAPVTFPARANLGPALAVACPSTRSCLALADAPRGASTDVVALGDRHGSLDARIIGRLPPGWVPARSGHALLCPSAQRCLVAGVEGSGPAQDGRGSVLELFDGGARWRLVEHAKWDQGVEALACPTSRRCVGVGNGPPLDGAGVVAGTPVPSPWPAQLLPGGVGKLVALSCPTSTDCVAVGTVPGAAAVLVSNDAGRRWQPAAVPAWIEAPLPGPAGR